MSVINKIATVTIANGGTVSGSTDLEGSAVCAVVMPAAFTGIALTFQASHNNVTFNQVTKLDGSVYTIVVAASKYVVIPPADLCGMRYIKVVSGSAEGAARDIIILGRSV